MLRLIKIIKYDNDRECNVWRCKCDCGKYKDLPIRGFKEIKSCGCLRKKANENKRKYTPCGEITSTFWSKLVANANLRGIKITITIKEAWQLFLKQNKKCAYSGIVLKFAKNISNYSIEQTASLDRINNKKGYTKSNVQWVDKYVNFAKQDFTNDYFLNMIKNIAIYRNLINEK